MPKPSIPTPNQPAIDPIDDSWREVILEIVARAEFKHYGLRKVDESLALGSAAPPSWVWDDGELTRRLDGACAIDISRGIDEAMRLVSRYDYGTVYLLGSPSADHGQDDGEIVMRDAVVLAIVDRAEAPNA